MLQAGDSFYPTGSYAHSFGLEGLVQAGVVRDRATLREFIFRSVVPALRQSELPLATHAWRHWRRMIGGRSAKSVICPPRSSRRAKLAAPPTTLAVNALNWSRPCAIFHRPRRTSNEQRKKAGRFLRRFQLRLEGRSLGAPLVAVLSACTYSTFAGVLSAAMKLLRLGQNASQSLLTEMLSAAPAMIVGGGVGAVRPKSVGSTPGSTSPRPATKPRMRGCLFRESSE